MQHPNGCNGRNADIDHIAAEESNSPPNDRHVECISSSESSANQKAEIISTSIPLIGLNAAKTDMHMAQQEVLSSVKMFLFQENACKKCQDCWMVTHTRKNTKRNSPEYGETDSSTLFFNSDRTAPAETANAAAHQPQNIDQKTTRCCSWRKNGQWRYWRTVGYLV